MKVINSINQHYQDQLLRNQDLKKKVDEIIKNNIKDTWHYFSRIKSQESYALKIETGRVNDPLRLEDFFGCTLVVENSIMINEAKNLINKFFTIINQRPSSENFTHNFPESFGYEDLRLYVKLKPREELPPDSSFNLFSDILFEIQIKTFLQHAWGVATHDLIYKGNEISWAKRRIAYQIKAMLEYAEISIHEIDTIKESKLLAKINKVIKNQNETKKFLEKNWNDDKLPTDLIRLTDSVHHLLTLVNLPLNDLQTLLDAESEAKRGIHTLDLPPFFVIIQTIINQKPSLFSKFFSNRSSYGKIVIPPEIDTKNLVMDDTKIIRI